MKKNTMLYIGIAAMAALVLYKSAEAKRTTTIRPAQTPAPGKPLDAATFSSMSFDSTNSFVRPDGSIDAFRNPDGTAKMIIGL